MLEGKRTWQVDHIRHATPRAKEIKIADQVANLIDIIELPSEKITVAYANKARDVYKSASAINPVLDETFKLIYGTVRNVLENVPLANRSLLSVDIDSLIALGRVNVNSKEKTPTAGSTAEKYISEQDYKNKATGVVAVGLDKNHDVVSYTIIVNPQGSEKTEANSSAEKLRAGIEKLSRRRVTTGVLTEDFGDDIALRVNYIKPSVNLDEFIKQAGSLISNELETTLNNSKQR
jgi:hypothetical protein